MTQYYPGVGKGIICGLFGKSRQAFYDQYNRIQQEYSDEALVIELVQKIRLDMPKIGTVKLHRMIFDSTAQESWNMGRDRFFDLLRENNLLIKQRKRYVRTTFSDHGFYKWPDLTIALQLNAVEQLWVSDITYLRITDGFVYLSLITDAYSKKIVGFHLSQQLKAQGCIIALNKAIAALAVNKGTLIHHSDRGVQYCCEPYVSKLQQHTILISMTQSGSPYENAIAERVNGILKNELGLNQTFLSYNDAIAPTHNAIDIYNRKRPHMSCGYLTPEHAHKSKQALQKAWKNKKYVKAI